MDNVEPYNIASQQVKIYHYKALFPSMRKI